MQPDAILQSHSRTITSETRIYRQETESCQELSEAETAVQVGTSNAEVQMENQSDEILVSRTDRLTSSSVDKSQYGIYKNSAQQREWLQVSGYHGTM